jgi:hypothetical protein
MAPVRGHRSLLPQYRYWVVLCLGAGAYLLQMGQERRWKD